MKSVVCARSPSTLAPVLFLWLVATTALLLVAVQAYPNGAGGCGGGLAAVNGYHLDFGGSSGRTGFSGTLKDLGVVVTVGGTVLAKGVSVDMAGNTKIDWGIDVVNTNVTNFQPFRGVLFRVQALAGIPFTLTGDSRLEYAQACDMVPGNVFGMTHMDRTDKTSVKGTMRVDGNGPVAVDVTIVIRNGRIAEGNGKNLTAVAPAASIYGFTSFAVKIINAAPFAPLPPVAAPSSPNACSVNQCKSTVLGLSGRLMTTSLLGICLDNCVFSFFVGPLKALGWKCGGCAK